MRELSLNIMDVAQNSISAGASLITIAVEEDARENRLTVRIEDDGCGMSEEQVKQALSPFYTTRTTRPVGLGIPLFKMACEQTGGEFTIASVQGEGTRVKAAFRTDHIDMTPLGDISETVLLLVIGNEAVDFLYIRRRDESAFRLDTRELREILEGVPFSDPEVTLWIREHLREQEEEL